MSCSTRLRRGIERPTSTKEMAFLRPSSSSKGNQPPFKIMPGDSCVPRGRYLEFGTHGSGAFGWINQGVDTKTGNPIAIKELRITNSRSRTEVMTEVNMGRRFIVSYIELGLRRYLIHHRIKEVSFLSWTHCASTVVLIAAVTWKSSICLCLAHSQISPVISGYVLEFLERASCNG